VACATKNYGTGGDCSLGCVEIAPDGRISVRCDGVEMGNGIGTAAANRVAAHLGGVADEVALAQVGTFAALGLVTSGDSFTMTQKTQDAAARNARWVPAISSATAASTGAYVGTHPAAEAARVVFRFGLWPAALDLWGIAPHDPKAKQWQTARWKDGQLLMPGLPSRLAGGRGKGACAQRCDRGDDARLQSLGVVAGDLRGERTALDCRHRCAGRAPGRGQVRSHRSFQREVSTH
jgi:CO/xanthine dehydrogenase Mo-binding subunit